MASEPIHIHDDSELSRVLDEAADHPVRFERGGVVYRVSVEESAIEYDTEAPEQELHNPFADMTDEEAEALIAQIYENRRLGTPLNVKPRWMDDEDWIEPDHPFNKSGGTFSDEEVAESLAWLREHLRLRRETGVEEEWGEESWVAARKGLEMYAFCWDDIDPDLVEERYQASRLALQSGKGL